MEFSKKYKVNSNFKADIEPHEVFLDSLAQKREIELGISEKKSEVPLGKEINLVLYGVFVFFTIILLIKTFDLQIIRGKTFFLLSENNKTRIYLDIPERGVIYDRNFNQLVKNSPAFDLVLDKRELLPSSFERIKEIEEIALIIGKNPEVLKQEIEESEASRVLISANISHQNLVLFETKLKDFPGFQIEKNTVRNYISGSDFSHLIGYTGKINKEELKNSENYSITDYIGKIGLEKFYEKILRGNPGKIKVDKDVFGNKKSEETLTLAETGKNLVLYLDLDLQQKITEELKKSMERIGAKKAAAIALDPKTGGVLGMVSLPSFDNNLLNQGISFEQLRSFQNDPLKPFLNRIISGSYVTGSVIKPLIAQAALEEEIISPEEKLYGPLELCLFNKYSGEKECFSDWKFHGWTDIRRAIAESINPFFYIVGGGYTAPNFADSRLPKNFVGLGENKIKKWLVLFNWGEKTGIDLPGEKAGRIPDPEWKKEYFGNSEKKIWTIGDTYHLSIGQGDILVTPLQVAVAISAIANKGTLYQPRVVQKIAGGEEFKPEIIRENFIDSQNAKIIREGMRRAVTDGSARILLNLPIKAAAKTGTAQTSMKDNYHHWVTVFAPYDDPQIVLTIVIEEVKGLQSAVLPVAQQVLNWYFSSKNF